MNIVAKIDFAASANPIEDQHLAINLSDEGENCVVHLTGAVVGGTAGDLLDALPLLVTGGCKNLIVDVSGVRAVSRAGLRGIIVAAQMLQVKGGQMRICSAHGEVLRALKNLSLGHLIRLDKDPLESRAALAKEVRGYSHDHSDTLQIINSATSNERAQRNVSH